MEFLYHLIDTTDFPARWGCGNWTAIHGWTHIISDVLIWFAYMAIPIGIAYIVKWRTDTPFPRLAWLFIAFIISCGFVHLTDAIIFWTPIYRVSAVIKVITAITSVATVIAMIRYMPKVMRMPGAQQLRNDLKKEGERREAELRSLMRLHDEQYQARLAALVETSYDAIIGKDLEGVITSWNRGAEEVYGYTTEEAVGNTISIILPEGIEREEDAMREVISEGQSLEQFETIRRRKDGETIPVSVTASPITDLSGIVVGSSTIERDITDRKRAEQEMKRAKEAAENTNKLRGEFLANVSHELRTPMNSILGMTQLALTEDISDLVEDYLKTLKHSADGLLQLLNEILDFSKIEAGKFRIEEEAVELRQLVDESVKAISPRGFDKGLEVIYEIDPNLPNHIFADPLRLRQILTNLLSNSIKFTHQGEILLRVRRIRKLPGEVRLKFLVRDTGIGISEEDQQQIIEPFMQADTSSTRKYGGTGLGLAITQELLRLMGSQLKIQSEVGVGSTFSFVLNLQVPSEESLEPPITADDFEATPVLVVDDNATNRRMLEQALKNWSMKPYLADSADTALGLLNQLKKQNQQVPLIIVDALMPQVDGFQLAEKIREVIPDSDSPIILMVSSTDRSTFNNRKESQYISAFLQKPVSQSDLFDAVIRSMHLGKMESSSRIARPEPKFEMIEPLSVLLAEDTAANQKVVMRLLNRNGHSVDIANNGREAFEKYKNGNYDLIFMDVQMPILDGYQATAAIRRHEESTGKSIPIVAMTAHAMRGDRERCLEAGMDAYLSKPIDFEQLIKTLESFAVNHRDTDTGNAVESPKKPKLLDVDAALKRLAGDEKLYREFVTYFDEDLPPLLEQLTKAKSASDFAGLHHAAHAIKGLSASIGATMLSQAAAGAEGAGKRKDANAANVAVDDLLAEYEAVQAELETYRH